RAVRSTASLALFASRSYWALRASAARRAASAAASAARVSALPWKATARRAPAPGTVTRAPHARTAATAARAKARLMPSPCPMIGVAGKQAGGAEQLFKQHRPDEQMRPGRLAESHQAVGRVAVGARVAVSSADQETRFANAVVAPVAQQLGKRLGRDLRAALVEQDGAERRLRLGCPPTAFGQLREPQRPGDALRIALDQLRLGRAADLPASDH